MTSKSALNDTINAIISGKQKMATRRSIVKGAVVGGVIAGPTGAIIGAIVGSK